MSLAFENVTKRFGAVTAVDRVSLAAEDGEFVVLLGPSGCGKSTLLRMAAGLEQPDAGVVRVGGRDVTALEPRERDVAMVFQNYALYPHMTVAGNIGYPLRVRKRPAAEIAAEVARVAGMLGLGDLLGRHPRELSGGQRQRVALARAVIRKPKAFLMDEPLSNLDARLRVETRFELKHLQHNLATVTLYVTHDQAEAMTLAHRIAVLRDGRLLQFDTPANIYRTPANLFVAGFVGSPSMNFIEGRIERGQFEGAGITTWAGLADRAAVTLGVRPEDVDVSTTPLKGGFPAAVYATEEMGNETFVRLAVSGGRRITARVSADVVLGFDAPVWFLLRGRLHFFDTQTAEAMR